MNRERGARLIRVIWLFATILIFMIILFQLDIYGDRVEEVLGWFGATTAAVLALALFGKAVTPAREEQRDSWPVYLVLGLSLIHITASIWTLVRVAQAFSLAPLEQILPLYGVLNPMVLAALAAFFRPGAAAEIATPANPAAPAAVVDNG